MLLKKPVLAILFLIITHQVFSISKTDSLLNEVSKAIKNNDTYINNKQERIKQLQQVILSNDLTLAQQFKAYDRIYNEYRTFQYDSAFTYALKLQKAAHALQDPVKTTYSTLKISLTLLSSGMFTEALDSLNSVSIKNMPDSIKAEYYALKARANYDLSGYTQDRYYSPLYRKAGEAYVDSALALINKDNLQFYALRGMKHSLQEPESAKTDYQIILTKFKPTLNQYAMATNSLGNIYYSQGEKDKAIEMMALSAIADLKASVKEGVALMTLAEFLYENGDENRAYDFIKQALEDADFYGAKQRKIQVAAILPVIEGERLATVEQQRSKLFIYSTAVTLLSLLVVIFAVIIFRQLNQLGKTKKIVTEAYDELQEMNSKLQATINQLQITNERLNEANIIKEEYIGYSFNQYSDYIDKIEKLKKAIERKLSAKKFDEIGHVLDSVNLKKEREAVYHSFDRVFIKLFPNFVSSFNSFFKEEDRVVLKDNNTLTIELRIFALIRIGIHEHEQIAKILEYSVRTIYNYKTKIKSKSILSNDEFERKIMEIKPF